MPPEFDATVIIAPFRHMIGAPRAFFARVALNKILLRRSQLVAP
jgi:hypothetical protein